MNLVTVILKKCTLKEKHHLLYMFLILNELYFSEA